MEQVAVLPSPLKPAPALPSLRAMGDWMELARQLLDLDPVAMSIEGCFRLSANVDRGPRPVLLPIGRASERLELARAAAKTHNPGLRLFACTEARGAVAVIADSDPRDRRYLSGARTVDGFPAYCGGLDAAVHRALEFARRAEVVCLKVATVDLGEARRFAAEVRAAFPGKNLGFGHSPRPDGAAWNEAAHAELERELRGLGYDYYFVTQFGSTIFPDSPVRGPWALFDDAVPSTHSGAGETAGPECESRELEPRGPRFCGPRLRGLPPRSYRRNSGDRAAQSRDETRPRP
jgi:hypothetical protein